MEYSINMTYRPENSLNIGQEEYALLCNQEYVAGTLVQLLVVMIEQSGWTLEVSEHPMFRYIEMARENQEKLNAYRSNENEKIRKALSSS